LGSRLLCFLLQVREEAKRGNYDREMSAVYPYATVGSVFQLPRLDTIEE